MIPILKRNSLLYFKNPMGVFFSLLSSLIIFGLYELFLKNSMLESWTDLPDKTSTINLWVLSGMVAATGLTTAVSTMGQLVSDRETQKYKNFILTSIPNSLLTIGYLLSGFLISIMMQTIVFIFGLLYFSLSDDLLIDFNQLPFIFSIILLNALISATIGLFIASFINKQKNFATAETIIGTAAGFLIGVYMPIGALPNTAQQLIKIFPNAQIASLLRRNLLANYQTNIPKASLATFNEYMGIGFVWKEQLTNAKMELSIIILTTLFILASLFTLNSMRKEVT